MEMRVDFVAMAKSGGLRVAAVVRRPGVTRLPFVLDGRAWSCLVVLEGGTWLSMLLLASGVMASRESVSAGRIVIDIGQGSSRPWA